MTTLEASDRRVFSVVLEKLLDFILRNCAHEPGLFRSNRPAPSIRALWLALQPAAEICAASETTTGTPFCGYATWSSKISQRLAEAVDPILVSQVLLYHLRVNVPLVPPSTFAAIVALDLSRDEEARQAAARAVLYDVPLSDWKLVINRPPHARTLHPIPMSLTISAHSPSFSLLGLFPCWGRKLRDLCRLLAQLAQLGRGAVASGAHTPESLAFALGPLLTVPDGCAFMAVRHIGGLAALRRLMKARAPPYPPYRPIHPPIHLPPTPTPPSAPTPSPPTHIHTGTHTHTYLSLTWLLAQLAELALFWLRRVDGHIARLIRTGPHRVPRGRVRGERRPEPRPRPRHEDHRGPHLGKCHWRHRRQCSRR